MRTANPAATDTVDAAIAAVLDAERAAGDAVAAASETAAAMTESARAAARAIAEATERRIRGIRAAFEDRTAADVAALDAAVARAGEPHELSADERARVAGAAAALAAELLQA